MARSIMTIKPNERLAAVGKTQSGKTHFVGKLAQSLRRLIVIDGKGYLANKVRARDGDYSWNLTEWNSREGADVRAAMERGEGGRLRVPAPLRGDYEGVFRWAFHIENVTIVIDEMYSTAKGTDPGHWLNLCYTQGAQKGIGVWACSQRPRRVPSVMYSESEWKAIFRLPKADDRKFMADEIAADSIPLLPPRDFYLYNDSFDAPQHYRGIIERKAKR